MTYQINHVKRDPDTGAVAIRTIFPDEAPTDSMAWLVASNNIGARNARTIDVDGWPDLYIPEVPA